MQLKEIVFIAAELLKINRLFRFINKHKIAILNYHGVIPDNFPIDSWMFVKERKFIKQIGYLKKYYRVVSIQDAFKEKTSKHANSRPKVVITFDDGYRNNYLTAFPILKRFDFPATIFLCTKNINSSELFWFDKAVYAIQDTRCERLDLSSVNFGTYHFSIKNNQSRWNNIHDLLEKLKQLSPSKREAIVKEITNKTKPDFKNIDAFLPLRTEEIEDMLSSGLIEVGSHTHGHDILTQLIPKEAKKTIQQSIEYLKKITGRNVIYFSYPNGNFNKMAIKILEEEKIYFAFTTVDKFWSPNSSFNTIPRLGIGGYDSFGLFAGKLSGFMRFVLK